MKCWIAIYFTILLPYLACAQLGLHSYVSDGGVLQRNQPIPVIGNTQPHSSVEVHWQSAVYQGRATETGAFTILLPAQEHGGPYTLKVISGTDSVTIQNILVGDVWVASGQSNMEWPVEKSQGRDEAIKAANYPAIRFLTVKKGMSVNPEADFRQRPEWIPATDDNIRAFSAVAYFFAENIFQKTGVPIGVVHASWGGTPIEAWMGFDVLHRNGHLPDTATQESVYDALFFEKDSASWVRFDDWKTNHYKKDIGMDEQWYQPGISLTDWKPISVPGFWEDQVPELAGFDGAVWYRRSFDVPSSFLQHDIRVWLSQIDDHNICWVNGQYLGETYWQDSWTNYQIPKGLLREKDNTIVLRVYDTSGKGGMKGWDWYYDFFPEGGGDVRASLNGEWRWKKGAAHQYPHRLPVAKEHDHPRRFPSLLFNAMIHPLTHFPVCGVIWYQGENNKQQAYEYRSLFPAMITDWRQRWQQPDLPFFFVQLAAFGALTPAPRASDAAELREAQYKTLSLPNTGMACTIDIGDQKDIHPTNKKDVGLRLARHALKQVYGFSDLVTDGPMYQSHAVSGSKIALTFRHAEGLHTADGAAPTGFEVAAADGVFHTAQAKLTASGIDVWSE